MSTQLSWFNTSHLENAPAELFDVDDLKWLVSCARGIDLFLSRSFGAYHATEPIPVLPRVLRDEDGNEAIGSFTPIHGQPPYAIITVNPSSGFCATALVHEAAHALSIFHLGTPQLYVKDDPYFSEFRELVSATSEYEYHAKCLRDHIVHNEQGPRPATPADLQMLAYLTSPDEYFARAFTQYAAAQLRHFTTLGAELRFALQQPFQEELKPYFSDSSYSLLSPIFDQLTLQVTKT